MNKYRLEKNDEIKYFKSLTAVSRYLNIPVYKLLYISKKNKFSDFQLTKLYPSYNKINTIQELKEHLNIYLNIF